MNENLPACTCGVSNWQGCGGSMGPGYAFYTRVCAGCGNHLFRVDREGLWTALLLSPELSEVVTEYSNTTMAVQARIYKEQWEAAVSAVEKIQYDALVESWGMGPAKGCLYTPRKIVDENGVQTGWEKAPVTRTRFDGSTYESEDIVYDYLDNEGNRIDIDVEAFHEAVKAMYEACRHGPELIRAPDLRDVPNGITAFVLRKGQWDRVNSPPKNKLPPLVDPLRKRHDLFYKEAFAAVTAATGGVQIHPTAVPNQYYKDVTNSEPWYEFSIHGSKFTVGSRKRVISVSVKFPDEKNVAEIRDLANSDGTTYEVNRAWWKHDGDTALEVLVHAWSKDKLIQYLTILVGAAIK